MTTVTREHLAGLKLALECVGYSNSETSAWDKYEELEELIAQASAAPEQEPVAYLCNGGTKLMFASQKQEAIWNAGRPLYTHVYISEVKS